MGGDFVREVNPSNELHEGEAWSTCACIATETNVSFEIRGSLVRAIRGLLGDRLKIEIHGINESSDRAGSSSLDISAKVTIEWGHNGQLR